MVLGGRCSFHCLLFGLKSSAELFQQAKEKRRKNWACTILQITADAMIIAAKTPEDHAHILHQITAIVHAKYIRFNKSKIQFKIDLVKYIGHVVMGGGGKTRWEQSYKDMGSLEDRQDVLRFLDSLYTKLCEGDYTDSTQSVYMICFSISMNLVSPNLLVSGIQLI